MAEDPEVKELMKRKGLESAYVHADELAQMFCRELFLAPPRESWVIVARTFPAVKGTMVEPTDPDPKDEETRSAGGVRFPQKDFPMIERVEKLDLKKGELAAARTFSQVTDLWLPDHKPFQSLKHPLVSGIMAVETFLEAAHLLYPHLSVLGMRRLKFEEILECSPGHGTGGSAPLPKRGGCDPGGSLSGGGSPALGLSPSGRSLDTWSTNYRGQVILGPRTLPLPSPAGFHG